jgi:hypothetical protein
MLLRLTLALAVVVGAAAAMKASQAAEDTPYIGVYEANVTDMEGYKANFLTPLQPKVGRRYSGALDRQDHGAGR